jgi:hypothetical protein
MIKLKLKRDHASLVLWATDCAQHVLLCFEREHPGDDRPRKAIEAARAWVRDEITVGAARSAAFAAHAAARNADKPAARAAARAAGHAAASVHVASHAPHAANYAVTAAEAANILGEREWQYQHLPKRLLPLMKKSKIFKI